MEKIKWLIIGLLAVVLFLVVFFNKNSNDTEVSNFIEFNVKHLEKSVTKEHPSLINEGNYILLLDDVQIISENAFGFHLQFSLPFENESMIFVFDIVDTANVLNKKTFPITFTNSNYFSNSEIPFFKFYRSFAKVGFSKAISPTLNRENTIYLINVLAKIDSFEIVDGKVSLDFNFALTHSDLLVDVFKFRYLINGKVSITDAVFTERVLSFN